MPIINAKKQFVHGLPILYLWSILWSYQPFSGSDTIHWNIKFNTISFKLSCLIKCNCHSFIVMMNKLKENAHACKIYIYIYIYNYSINSKSHSHCSELLYSTQRCRLRCWSLSQDDKRLLNSSFSPQIHFEWSLLALKGCLVQWFHNHLSWNCLECLIWMCEGAVSDC